MPSDEWPLERHAVIAVLTKQQYQVLNSCTDDWELFYFPFAEVNYGGQVFSRADGPNRSQYEDQEAWRMRISGKELVSDIVKLFQEALLDVRRIHPDGRRELIDRNVNLEAEFECYSNYDCLTVQEHERRFGYGPHEFKSSLRGKAEIENPAYRAYDRELGWPST